MPPLLRSAPGWAAIATATRTHRRRHEHTCSCTARRLAPTRRSRAPARTWRAAPDAASPRPARSSRRTRRPAGSRPPRRQFSEAYAAGAFMRARLRRRRMNASADGGLAGGGGRRRSTPSPCQRSGPMPSHHGRNDSVVAYRRADSCHRPCAHGRLARRQRRAGCPAACSTRRAPRRGFRLPPAPSTCASTARQRGGPAEAAARGRGSAR